MRKSYISFTEERPNEIFVVFGGGIGIKGYPQSLLFGDEKIEYQDVELTTLKETYRPGTDLLNDNPFEKDIENTPRIHLLFDKAESIDAMIGALETIKERLCSKTQGSETFS